MIPSPQCIDFIKTLEGFKSEPYGDVGGRATIGYGTTRYPNGQRVTLADLAINQVQATEYLQWDVDIINNTFTKLIKVELLQCQLDALVSFVYNIGIGAFSESTILKTINNNPNDYINIQAQFMRWVYVKKIIKLINRRKAEYKLYASGLYK